MKPDCEYWEENKTHCAFDCVCKDRSCVIALNYMLKQYEEDELEVQGYESENEKYIKDLEERISNAIDALNGY